LAGTEPTRLVVWRHGRTAWNATNRIQGQAEAELDELGHRQAAAAAAVLAAGRPAAIVSSDLGRARTTATYLAELTGLPVTLDPRLRERHFGQWQGLAVTEVAQRFPAEYARWRTGDQVAGCGVEDVDDLAKRAAAGFVDAAALAPGATVVAVSHGGTARFGMAGLLGWPVQVLRGFAPLGNCRWVELRDTPVRGWQLYGYNAGAG